MKAAQLSPNHVVVHTHRFVWGTGIMKQLEVLFRQKCLALPILLKVISAIVTALQTTLKQRKMAMHKSSLLHYGANEADQCYHEQVWSPGEGGTCMTH